MEAVQKRVSVHRRPPVEPGRRIIGTLLELGIKAYGTAAAVSVALSDAETVGGKLTDAVTAVPSLMERYRQAKYAFDHAEEIQAALDYVHRHAPDSRQLETAVRGTYQALQGVKTVFGELGQAKEALGDLSLAEAFEHIGRAWTAMPDLGSIAHLAEVAQNVTSLLIYLNSFEVDLLAFYQGMLSVADNFAHDEIAGTLGVMGVALVIAFALGMGAGFWGRRGRPGIIVSTMQGWGARLFPDWYARHLEGALGRSLYAVARERIQGDIVVDPEQALDPDAYQKLEQYFERRLSEKTEGDDVPRQGVSSSSRG